MIVVGTGHRPPRLGLGYDAVSNKRLTLFAERHLSSLSGVTEVVSGGAQGWDQAIAHAAIRLKIPLFCVLPFDGMDRKWPEAGRTRFSAILGRASKVHVCHTGKVFRASQYIDRDRYMVDYAKGAGRGMLLALWDGVRDGGTWHTVNYAWAKELEMKNMWTDWQAG